MKPVAKVAALGADPIALRSEKCACLIMGRARRAVPSNLGGDTGPSTVDVGDAGVAMERADQRWARQARELAGPKLLRFVNRRRHFSSGSSYACAVQPHPIQGTAAGLR